MTMPMTITTDRMILKPLGPDDAGELHSLWVDPDVRKYLWDDLPVPEEQVADILEESQRLMAKAGVGLFGATLRSHDELIGFCGHWFFHDPPELQIVFGVSPDWWGQGLGTELARTMLDYGFKDLELKEIIGSTDEPNVASLRVMEKSGMHALGLVEKAGQPTVYYRLSRDEYQAATSAD